MQIFFLRDLVLVRIFLRKVFIATFNISFESTKDKQQYGTKITCTEVRKNYGIFKNVLQILTFRPIVSQILGGLPVDYLHEGVKTSRYFGRGGGGGVKLAETTV